MYFVLPNYFPVISHHNQIISHFPTISHLFLKAFLVNISHFPMITSHFSVYAFQLFLSETLDISTVSIVAPGALKGHGAVFATAMYELLKKL